MAWTSAGLVDIRADGHGLSAFGLQFLGDHRGLVQVQIDDGDRGASFGQGMGKGVADALRAAGHQRHAPVQAEAFENGRNGKYGISHGWCSLLNLGRGARGEGRGLSSVTRPSHLAPRPSAPLYRHINLCLHRRRRHVDGKVEGGHALGEGEAVGEERLHIQLAAADERNRTRVDMGIAEDVLDMRLLHHGRRHIIGDGLERDADKDDGAAWAERREDTRRRPLVAAALEDQVDAPALGQLVHDCLEILLWRR